MRHKQSWLNVLLVVLFVFCAIDTVESSTCKPDCTKFDTCILVLSPLPLDTVIEGEILPVKYVLSYERASLVEVQLSDDSGKTWRGIKEKPFTSKACTTSIQSALATQLSLFSEGEFLKYCKIRLVPFGEMNSVGESEGFFIIKKRTSGILPAKRPPHRNFVKPVQKQSFNLHGQILQGKVVPVNRLVIARDSEGRVVPVFTLR